MVTTQSEPLEYVLNERRFSGSREEVLEQLDELVEALLGFRQSLVLAERREQAPPAALLASRRARFAVLALAVLPWGWPRRRLSGSAE